MTVNKEHTDTSGFALCSTVSCFSCVQGYCTALEKVIVCGCVFYKDVAQNRKKIRKCFYRLIILERFDQRTQEEYDNQADGTEAYVAVTQNFFYGTIGFPIRIPMPPDPVVLAYRTLGAGMIYRAAEDYIAVLRMLWSGDYRDKAQYSLIINKWELETLIGSRWYWQFTNISPNRMLDQCRATAEEQARKKIERLNRRIAAGIEVGEEA